MSSNVVSSSSSSVGGMDVVLTRRGKLLQPGESLRMTLVKGSTITNQLDPVANNNKKKTKQQHIPPLDSFPQVLKFGESVVRPDFVSSTNWKTSARLYQQDVPKAQVDSSEDEAESAVQQQKSKRRRRNNDTPQRQWVLQEEEEFVQYMISKKKSNNNTWNANAPSSRYEGVSEYNPSRYVILSFSGKNQISVQTMPPNALVAMSQPRQGQALSMTQAEQAMQDARGKMTRFMMHKNTTSASGNTKSRLLNKLSLKTDENDDDDDDVMADVAFRRPGRKSSSLAARRELLSSLTTDDGVVTMDEEGVLGGTNHAEFGGKRHFGKVTNEEDNKTTKNDQDKKANTGMGNDGLAMADDFYQRDVQAEYEELDYDANELFDDDDVDLGEAEMVVDTGGFAADNEDEEEDEEEDEDDNVGDLSGAAGLATVAGFRAMLAKARGDSPTNMMASGSEDEANKEEDAKKKDRPTSPSSQQSAKQAPAAARAASPIAAASDKAAADNNNASAAQADPLAKMEAAAAEAAKKAAEKSNPTPAASTTNMPPEPETDENGQRIISLDAIRREIWLHHGSIPLKRLMKIFDTKRATPERRKKFLGLVKELCIMKKDAVEGSILVLKQHYANMG